MMKSMRKMTDVPGMSILILVRVASQTSVSTTTALRDVSANLNSRVASQTASLVFCVLSVGRN